MLRSAADLSGPDDLAAARAAVVAARAGEPATRRAAREILAFIDAHPDALHRSCHEGHLTGSAVVIDPTTDRVLLLFHAKVRRWLQPGGHADGDGNLAARGAPGGRGGDRHRGPPRAHAGRRPRRPRVPQRPGTEPDHLHLDVRHLVVAPAGAVARGNHESERLRWFSPEEVHERSSSTPARCGWWGRAFAALAELPS